MCSLSKSILHCYNIDIVLSGVFFGRMAVDAVEHLDDDMDLSLIGIKKVQGGSLAVCWFVFFPVIITDVFWSSGWSSKFTLLGVSECSFEYKLINLFGSSFLILIPLPALWNPYAFELSQTHNKRMAFSGRSQQSFWFWCSSRTKASDTWMWNLVTWLWSVHQAVYFLMNFR